jgi:F0F1-type ATP synthase membrane subunit b/b'
MAVQPASLEVLEKAAVPPAQARAIVQAIEIEIAGAKDTLATRQDMLILRHEMAELRTELRQEMNELHTELRQEMNELRSELRHEMGALRTELRQDMAGLQH